VPVAFAFLFLPVSQVAPEISASLTVLDDPLVDGLMAHNLDSFDSSSADDLLGT